MSSVIYQDKNSQTSQAVGILLACRQYCTDLEADQNPCLECHDCTLVINNQNPDLQIITKPVDKTAISIDQIKQMITRLSFSSYLGGSKTVLILHAHEMTQDAQNALLKTLEEHGENTEFILTTKDVKSLLPTIKSRCSILSLEIPPRLISSVIESMPTVETPKKDYPEKSLTQTTLEEIDNIWKKKDLDKRQTSLDFLKFTLDLEQKNLQGSLLANDEETRKILINRLQLLEKSIMMVERNVNPRLVLENYIIQNLDGND